MSTRESKIERAFAKYVKARGEECIKLSAPGTLGLPDRFIPFGYVNGELGQVTWFIEFKRPGEDINPDGPQQFWKSLLERKGYRVDVFDGLEEAKEVFEEILSLRDDLR